MRPEGLISHTPFLSLAVHARLLNTISVEETMLYTTSPCFQIQQRSSFHKLLKSKSWTSARLSSSCGTRGSLWMCVFSAGMNFHMILTHWPRSTYIVGISCTRHTLSCYLTKRLCRERYYDTGIKFRPIMLILFEIRL